MKLILPARFMYRIAGNPEIINKLTAMKEHVKEYEI